MLDEEKETLETLRERFDRGEIDRETYFLQMEALLDDDSDTESEADAPESAPPQGDVPQATTPPVSATARTEIFRIPRTDPADEASGPYVTESPPVPTEPFPHPEGEERARRPMASRALLAVIGVMLVGFVGWWAFQPGPKPAPGKGTKSGHQSSSASGAKDKHKDHQDPKANSQVNGVAETDEKDNKNSSEDDPVIEKGEEGVDPDTPSLPGSMAEAETQASEPRWYARSRWAPFVTEAGSDFRPGPSLITGISLSEDSAARHEMIVHGEIMAAPLWLACTEFRATNGRRSATQSYLTCPVSKETGELKGSGACKTISYERIDHLPRRVRLGVFEEHFPHRPFEEGMERYSFSRCKLWRFSEPCESCPDDAAFGVVLSSHQEAWDLYVENGQVTASRMCGLVPGRVECP